MFSLDLNSRCSTTEIAHLFNRYTSAARRTDAVGGFGLFEFVTAFGDGINMHARDERQVLVATMTELVRFQTSVEPPLAFIECAQDDNKEEEPCLETSVLLEP